MKIAFIAMIFSFNAFAVDHTCPVLGNYVNCPQAGFVFGYESLSFKMSTNADGFTLYEVETRYPRSSDSSIEFYVTDNKMHRVSETFSFYGREYCQDGKLVSIGSLDPVEGSTGSRTEYSVPDAATGDLRIDWYWNKNDAKPNQSTYCTRVL